MTPELRARLRNAVDARHVEQIRFLAELVRVPSDNPPGDCAAHAARAAELLRGLGLVVEEHPVPPERVAASGMRSVVNLVVRRRFGDGPVVALSAHGDAVPPGSDWTVAPYAAEIRDGVMYGRGVAVSKSDFATYAFALLALEAARAPLRGAVELHFSYDEEAGGLIGPAFLLDAGLTRPDYAICAGFSHAVTVAHNGCLQLEVVVEGRSAHAACPALGADALKAATRLLAALYRRAEELTAFRSAVPGIDSPTLVVGLIAGGINTNVVPDRVTFRVDRRILPEEDPTAVERALVERIKADAAALPNICLTVRHILLAQPLTPCPGQKPLVDLLQRYARDIFGEPIEATGVPLYTDARHYGAAGIPTVLYGAGPRSLREANAHGADEKLDLEDLRKATQVVALTLTDLLTAPGAP